MSTTWSITARGLRTVIVLELRQRVRSTRWVAVLLLWVAALAALTWLTRYSVGLSGPGPDALPDDPRATADMRADAGRQVFGLVVYLVLSLGALITPALAATSINGDRAAGVLATLQTTLLTPAEIVLGKLMAAWAVALALLVTAAPFLVWAFLDGGTPGPRLVVVLLLLAAMLLVICAIGLGWSSLAARTASSVLLSYVTTAFLGLGLPLLFVLSLPLVTEQVSVVQRQPVPVGEPTGDPMADPMADPSTGVTQVRCESFPTQVSVARTERTWWLLAASPYVVVADAAPRAGLGPDESDPLTAVRTLVRETRLGEQVEIDYCDTAAIAQRQQQRVLDREALGVSWPFGLAANLGLGTLFVVIAIRRLRAPTRELPRGTRVA